MSERAHKSLSVCESRDTEISLNSSSARGPITQQAQ
uniref:Uncharacterized protein n=1 Tax=Anguilla anguilla TaxID=7936 RepID=A0A0E9W8V1_ANGAN